MKKILACTLLLCLFAFPAFSMSAAEQMKKMQNSYCATKSAYFLSPTAQTFKAYLSYRNKISTMAHEVANVAMMALEEHPELKASEPRMNTSHWYYTLAMATYTEKCPDHMQNLHNQWN